MSENTKNYELQLKNAADLQAGSSRNQKIKQANHSGDGANRLGSENSGVLRINDYYGEILSQINEAVIIVDSQEQIVYLNPTAERQYDISASDSLGHPLSHIHRHIWLNPEDEKVAYDTLRESGNWRGENIHLKNNGEQIYVESTVSVLRDSDKKAIGMLGIIRDITKRKRQEMKDEFLAEISTHFNHLSSPNEIMRIVGEKLSDFLNVSRVFFVEINQERNLSSVLYDWCPNKLPSTVGSYQLEEYGSKTFLQKLKKGKTVVINDINTDPITSAASEKFKALQIGSSLNAPYLKKGELKFLLAIQHRAAYKWREDEIELMRDLSGRVWTLLEGARAEQALRESEERYRRLFNSIDEGFCILEMIFDDNEKPVDYIFVEGNPVFEQLTGLKNAIGKTAREMVPDLEDFWFETYGRVALTGEAIRFENQSEPMNRWFDVHASRFGDETSRRVALVFNNITARKQAEHALQASETQKREILESISDGFFALDEEWKYSYVNPAAEKILFNESGSLLGKTIWEVYPGLIGSEFECVYRRVADERIPLAITSYYPDHERWYEVNAFPAAKGLTVYFRDVTGIKQAEERLRESEHELRSLADSISQLAWMAEPDGFIFWYNRRWYEYTGTTAEEMTGWGWEKVQDPEFLPEVLKRWKNSIADGKPFEMEFPLKGADGIYRWFLTRANPVRGSSGKIIRWFGTNTDIDQMRNMSNALAKSERQLQQLADAMPQVVWIAEADGTVIYYNQRAAELSGIEQTTDRTWKWEPALHPDDLQTTIEAWETAVREEKPYSKEHRIKMKDGSFRWHLSRSFPAFDEMGDISKWYGTATDIHQIKEAEAEREHLLEEVKAANRAKDEFLAVLSHELRTPLNTIYGWTQMLQKGGFDRERISKAIEIIARNVRLQNTLIEDLLDVSRIISGKMRLEPENLSLVSIIQSAIDAALPAAEKKQITIEAKLDSEADEIFGDRHRLQQIISNLLTNSLKFTPSAGVITIELKRAADTALISVSDTGIGITPDLLPHIFDRFRQANASSKRKFGGLGLGLTIVKHLVELHSGTISAFSNGENKGAVFTIEFPLQPQRITYADLKHSIDIGENDLKIPKLLAGAQILIVDDDPDSLDLLCFALKQQGADVICCDSGHKALEQFQSRKFDLLISDLGMAEIDGYDLVRQLREQENYAGNKLIPAIALTGYVSTEDRKRVLLAGFQIHLAKPANLEELLAAALKLIKK
jgi:PAS domain S-box-containing protein